MRIARVFNNNVVLGLEDDGREVVLLGRGLGFQVSRGDAVNQSLVERRFVPGPDATAERLAAFVQEIPLEDIDLTVRIVAKAREQLGESVSEHLLIPLADHISFALQRAQAGAQIDYPLKWEVTSLYPKEVAFARQSLELIREERGISLPDVEEVPLALHFVNAAFGVSDIEATVTMTQTLSRTLDIVRESFGPVDEESLAVSRFVTHLRYLFARFRTGSSPDPAGIGIIDAIRVSHGREYACAERVAQVIGDTYQEEVSEAETLYLALHVMRLTARAATEARHE